MTGGATRLRSAQFGVTRCGGLWLVASVALSTVTRFTRYDERMGKKMHRYTGFITFVINAWPTVTASSIKSTQCPSNNFRLRRRQGDSYAFKLEPSCNQCQIAPFHVTSFSTCPSSLGQSSDLPVGKRPQTSKKKK